MILVGAMRDGVRMSRYGGVSHVLRYEIHDHRAWMKEQGRSQNTVREYSRRLRVLAEWLEARGASLLTATSDLLQEWRSGLTVAGNSVLAYVSAARSFYRWAVWCRRCPADPTTDIPVPKWRKGRPRPIDEMLLITALVNAPKRLRPMLFLAALAGLRACEIAGLRREDILDSAEIPVMIIRGKGGKERIVPLSPQLWRELVGHGLPSSGWVFLRHDGQPGPNTPHRISTMASNYLKSLQIRETLHQLRHRFGTKAYAVHKDLRIVQELMGHENPSTTALYADYCRSEAFTTVLGVQIDLSQADSSEFPLNPARGQVNRPPHVPVRPSVPEREAPSTLRRRDVAIRRLQFTEQQTVAHDYPVRPPGRRPARVSNAVTAKTVLSLKIPDGAVQLGLSHELDVTARETPTSGGRRSRRR